MNRRSTALVALTLGPALALGLRGELLAANPPLRAGPEVEDHHHLPPEYATFEGPVPVGRGAAEYPLAADFVPAHSSNFTAGGITNVQYVVVHTIQGSYAGAISWFQNPSSNVSAHFMVRSGDGEVTQMVELADRAWHVGGSNPVSIGIEHEGWVDQPAYYTWAMYGASARLARWIADTHGLPLDRDHIVGHVELPNQTHTDPGVHWNWPRYLGLVRDLVGEGQVEAILVDAAAPCELQVTADTWLKATAEPAAELDDARRCALSPGD